MGCREQDNPFTQPGQDFVARHRSVPPDIITGANSVIRGQATQSPISPVIRGQATQSPISPGKIPLLTAFTRLRPIPPASRITPPAAASGAGPPPPRSTSAGSAPPGSPGPPAPTVPAKDSWSCG